MTATTAEFEPQASRMPWHVLAVGGLSLIWNVLCAVRYLAFQSGSLDIGTVAALQLVPFYDLPNIVMAAWAICTWGAVAGSALLLIRSKWTMPAFAFSLFGLIATSFYQFVLTANPVSIYETPVNLAVWIIALASLLYASLVESLGLLR